MLTLTPNQFNADGYWRAAIAPDSYEWDGYPSPKFVELFDQNGYDLTQLECLYAHANGQPSVAHRHRQALKTNWIEQEEKMEGAVLNHCFLFERKGYADGAKAQLERWAAYNPTIYKVLKYRPKWGIDFSMDWVDREGNAFEILHFEYDGFAFDEIQEVKENLEPKFMRMDWEAAGKALLARKSDWHHLGFFEQSDWKCNYFGLMPERFKMVAWE